MGWDVKNQHRYYSRSRRVAGRVVREYVGGGDVGERAAAEDARRREEREAAKTAWQRKRDQYEAATQPLDQLAMAMEAAARGSLALAGFYHQDPGVWRQRSGYARPSKENSHG